MPPHLQGLPDAVGRDDQPGSQGACLACDLVMNVAATIAEVAAHDAKNLMKVNLQKCHSVWQSFTKFIRGQVIDKSRVVDTVLVGVFHKNA